MKKDLVCQNCGFDFTIIGSHEQNQGPFKTLCKRCRDKAASLLESTKEQKRGEICG